MQTSNRTESQGLGKSPSGPFKKSFAESARFWERGRVIYNLILVGIVLAWIVASWPHFRPAMHLFPLLQLIVLGLIANGPYCAAYFVDIPMQNSSVSANWRRWRWLLWTAGTLLAIL